MLFPLLNCIFAKSISLAILHQAKKRFGQHFLKDKHIAEKICLGLKGYGTAYYKVLEIGPGLGVLTQFLYPAYGENLYLVEIDRDLVPSLQKNYPLIKDHIFQEDFLKLPLDDIFKEPFAVIGNFPYNISSQILFKVVEHRQNIPEMVGMFQKEVAQRVAAGPRTKDYGILSVWVQTFYNTTYLFTVNEGSFAPPPKVKSGVIRLERKDNVQLPVEAEHLLQVIKSGFNQRRKTLRNALRQYEVHYPKVQHGWLDKRAEELTWQDFISLATDLAD
jgi:16S rRNA (adenine1518-N6/adenine1519-N6)-dimethyltransferase